MKNGWDFLTYCAIRTDEKFPYFNRTRVRDSPFPNMFARYFFISPIFFSFGYVPLLMEDNWLNCEFHCNFRSIIFMFPPHQTSFQRRNQIEHTAFSKLIIFSFVQHEEKNFTNTHTDTLGIRFDMKLNILCVRFFPGKSFSLTDYSYPLLMQYNTHIPTKLAWGREWN